MLKFFKKHRKILFIHAGQAVTGLVSFSGHYSLIPFSLLFYVFWFSSEKRVFAFTSTFLYFLFSTKEFFWGAATYFGNSVAIGLLLWCASAILASFPFGVFFFWNTQLRMIGVLAATFFSIFPPIGIATWSHPLVSLGVLYPGGGFVALVLFVLATPFFCRWPVFAILPLFLSFTLTPKAMQGAFDGKAINTEFTFGYEKPYMPFGRVDYSNDYVRLKKIMSVARDAEADVILFPESVGGVWTKENERLWSSYQADSIIFLPSVVRSGNFKESVIVKLSRNEKEVVYRQRMPVPLSMWWPGRQFSYIAHWFVNPMVEVEGKKISFFICYEQFLVWPVLHSAYFKPDVFLAASNLWWAKGTNIEVIQNNIIRSWSELFAVPLIRAVNT